MAVQQLTPAPPSTVTVLVAARDLPAGLTLSPTDLMVTAVSQGMVPSGILLPRGSPPSDDGVTGWVGTRLSGPVRRGEVMTDAALLGDGLLVGSPPGSQAVPLRLSDPTTVQLLRQGQLVDVVISSSKGLDGPMQNDVVARSVAVLWTPALASSGSGLLPAQAAEALVVVAATRDQAILLAGASARGKVFLVLVK